MGLAIITRRGGNSTNDMKVQTLTPSDVTIYEDSNTPKVYVFVPIELFAEGDGYYTVELKCLHKGTKVVRNFSIVKLSDSTLSVKGHTSDAISGSLGSSANTTRMQYAYERDSSAESFEFVEGFILFHQ